MLKKFLILFCCSGLFSLGVSADNTILVLGDSLSAGYGISIDRGWVSLLQERLQRKGYRYHVVNASISGDTTRSAGVRLGKLLDDTLPDIAIVELGGNDGLRGLALEEIRRNLDKIISDLKQRQVEVLLVPMELPPNYGPVYNSGFQDVYRGLGAEHNIQVARFILDGIGDKSELMQSDGIHPKTDAQEMMLENIWPSLQPMLEKINPTKLNFKSINTYEKNITNFER